MESNNLTNQRPVALVILDGWGYAPRTERNAIAAAHTPYYVEICRTFPMTLLSTTAEGDGEISDVGDAEVGHLRMGTGRAAQTEISRIKNAIESGSFMDNEVLRSAFEKAKMSDSSVHFVGLLSDSGVHSSTENLFTLLRMAKRHELQDVFVHCILDGLDVAPRTADVYVEALELKLADIGIGEIATLCGRYFAMDNSENWERTARAYTMLAYAEGERAADAVTAIRSSFLRGISDEFISPIILERESGEPVTTFKDDDLVVFFNHRADGMLQIVRSVSIPDGSIGTKPIVNTVCMAEYDAGFGLPVAFGREPEKNTLTEILSELEIPNFKITESSRFHHLTYFFDGGDDGQRQFEQQILVPSPMNGSKFGQPEAESFKITDKFLRELESTGKGVFVINIPAADMMAGTGDMSKTVAAIQYIDTCLGGICAGMQERDGVVMITSTHGNCEEMSAKTNSESRSTATSNPVPFHYIDAQAGEIKLKGNGALEDVAPTILSVLGIDKPLEMTGTDLRGN
ncbi:MAG: 2,3-bisphosphoglycerate-independent phosphoglycerate mutase [Chloracidobacterium sp.]|nr:2,3-bisphosphoglycerate-independent phosphoglycerate mutase [Chloracidobacterium sp.]